MQPASSAKTISATATSSCPPCAEFYGNLYHLNAEEQPELPDYPKDPAFRAKFGAQGELTLSIANPALLGKIEPGKKFYLDLHRGRIEIGAGRSFRRSMPGRRRRPEPLMGVSS